jgi:adenine-specific DNA-methyltransferase
MQKIDLNDPDSKSADIVAGNIDALKALFPDAFTEGKIDFEVLKGLLGAAVDERDEKYGLNWHGKRRARQIALTPSTGTLLPCPDDSVDWDTTQNLMIEGDNLEVLKLLQKSYAGKVKLIYIDPPYNTGKDFVYPDDFRDSIKRYMELTGQVQDGQKISSNPESSGRFHTEWLNMMFPRLKVARGLMHDDALIVISIDDREITNLRRICDEVFGPENYKGTIVRTTGQTTGQDGGGLGSSFDYGVVYSKSADAELTGLPLDDDDIERYEETDERGNYALWQLRKTGSNDRRTDRPNMYFPIKDPDGEDVLPIGPTGYDSCWRFDPKGYKRLESENYIVWKKREKGGKLQWWPYVKTYLEGRTKRPSPLWDDLDGSKKASIDLRALLGNNVFSNPKPVNFVQRMLQIVPNSSKEEIILDFFGGSGTTGHAVLNQNAADGGKRRFIVVQLPEPLDLGEKDQSAAAAFCDNLSKPRTIAEITKERLRRAAKNLKSDNPLFEGDVGFRVFKLASSNISAWEPDSADLASSLLKSAEHLVQGRKEQDVLFELLLKLGLDLCVPIEAKTIAGKSVHSIGGGALIVCLADGLTKDVIEPLASGIVAWRASLAPAVDTRVVFKDSGFADDIAKTNMAAILNQNGITDVRSL